MCVTIINNDLVQIRKTKRLNSLQVGKTLKKFKLYEKDEEKQHEGENL